MDYDDLLFNKIAQSEEPVQKAIDYYDASNSLKRIEITNRLLFFLRQASPSKESINEGIIRSNIKRTYTPVVIFQKNTLNNAIRKIKSLSSEKDLRVSFIIMLHIFKVADTERRNTFCKNGCTHYWHNLSDS